MSKEQAISLILTVLISLTTGVVSGVVTVSALKTDVSWIKVRLSDHEMRLRELEKITYDSKRFQSQRQYAGAGDG